MTKKPCHRPPRKPPPRARLPGAPRYEMVKAGASKRRAADRRDIWLEAPSWCWPRAPKTGTANHRTKRWSPARRRCHALDRPRLRGWGSALQWRSRWEMAARRRPERWPGLGCRQVRDGPGHIPMCTRQRRSTTPPNESRGWLLAASSRPQVRRRRYTENLELDHGCEHTRAIETDAADRAAPGHVDGSAVNRRPTERVRFTAW